MKLTTTKKIAIISLIFTIFALAMVKVNATIPNYETYNVAYAVPNNESITVTPIESKPITEEEIVEEEIVEEPIVKPYDDVTVETLTNLLYGEARGIKELDKKSAVVWCVLNRYDNGKFGKTIVDVATAPNQFSGYVKNRTYKDMECYEECKAMVIDVLDRYYTEEQVGRTLPKDYLYFYGDGKQNHFTKEWRGKNYWNWSMENPYEKQ